MPFTVEDLIGDRPNPEIAKLGQTVEEALAKMIEQDYSQLPVVDEHDRPVAMLTSDSIVRALNNFGAKTKELRVVDAMVRKPAEFRRSDDLFSLLPALRDSYAVLVINRDGKLDGIVTSYDTAEYFRQRAQDMMFVREIEETIKNYVDLAFLQPSREIDETAQQAAIEAITPSNRELRGPFQQALQAWLQRNGLADTKVSNGTVTEVFNEYLLRKQAAKPFDKLSLGEYIELFLHDSRWERYAATFPLDRNAIRKLLKSVLDTRNDLAHFREEITPQQREELRFCRDWLQRHERDLNKAFEILSLDTSTAHPLVGHTTGTSTASGELSSSHVEEPVGAKESRYAPLAVFLQNLPGNHDQIQLSFDQVEEIIGDKLPAYARSYRSFWSNDPNGRPQAQQWLDIGWHVGTVNMSDELVSFIRIKERQQAYIDFFGVLLAKLRDANAFNVWNSIPDGSSQLVVSAIRKESRPVARFIFAFTRDRRFRVDLYIDTEDAVRNKMIFDTLRENRVEIEAEIGDQLSWERMDGSRASHVALYRNTFITNGSDKLSELQDWAVDAMVRFQRVMEDHLNRLLDNGLMGLRSPESVT